MRNFQKVLFIIALLFLSTQTFRHVYTKWFEPKESILVKYNEDVEKDIAKSKDIKELLALYDNAYKKVKEYEKNTENIDHDKMYHEEPYKTERTLKQAIEKWEEDNLEIQKMRFFWFCGFFSILIGFIVYAFIEQWVGIVGIITGFLEMIFWTCPTIFGFFGPRFQFDKLLNNKLIFSVISWILLIIVWLLLYKFPGKQNRDRHL
ncbi:MAG: hypothetical protein KJ915_06030 [Candidatus Omnitrophica bacterium]|nr:hypothetical protein [Candidatus Omnitrophota bacterium]